MKIIRINKDGTMNELDIKLPKNPINALNKNKISSGNDALKELYMWKYDSKIIKCYGWYDGEAGFENKHELAPNGSSTFLEEDSFLTASFNLFRSFLRSRTSFVN